MSTIIFLFLTTMDQLDSYNSTLDFQQNMILDMMKQHISTGLPFQYTSNRKRFLFDLIDIDLFIL